MTDGCIVYLMNKLSNEPAYFKLILRRYKVKQKTHFLEKINEIQFEKRSTFGGL